MRRSSDRSVIKNLRKSFPSVKRNIFLKKKTLSFWRRPRRDRSWRRKFPGCRQSLRQQRAHGSWQRQTPVPGRKSFCLNRKRLCPKRTLRSAFKMPKSHLYRKLRTRISPWRFPKQLPRKKSRSTKWIGRFMT